MHTIRVECFHLRRGLYRASDICGTLEFGTPAGDQIGVLGIRIPVGHTFTTLPALAK